MALFQPHSQSGLYPEELGAVTGFGLAYDPRTWPLKLDKEKRKRPFVPTVLFMTNR
ncbi:hypothetical protein [Planococcus antarcticus]|uniref:hypothetical protein n=1 Tax=Planococcus antarcticus TaxID=161360 RepID=UPI0002D27B41|nr:hypothetical protein [Planococcus antarcticus]